MKRVHEEPQRLEITLETSVESVDSGEQVTYDVGYAAGFDDGEQYEIALAVRECVANALKHGNQWDNSKHVMITFTVYSDRLVVQICDEGSGFDLDRVPDPLGAQGLRRPSGRGLLVARTFMDDLQVGCGPDGGAEVTLIKRRG